MDAGREEACGRVDREQDHYGVRLRRRQAVRRFRGHWVPSIEFRVDPSWQGGRKRRVAAGARPEDEILFCGGHEFPVGLEGGVEAACWYAAYQLQDDVMGEHNRPWPELIDETGAFVGVLAPPGNGSEIAQWELRGEPFCAVGHLRWSCEAADLAIRDLSRAQ